MYDRAAQVRWIMHAACAATFTLAMTLLASRLRRPVMRTMATVWWWQLVIALNLVAYFYYRAWFVEHTAIRVLGTLALHLPSFAMAPLLRRLRATLEGREQALSHDASELWRWSAAALFTTVTFELARSYWPDAASSITFVVSRVVAAVPYVYALWPFTRLATIASTREGRFAANAFRVALALRAGALAIDLVVRLMPWPEGSADMLTVWVVTSNLVALVAFGTILLFVALENERAMTMRQAAALHAAELRDAHSQRLQSLGRLARGVAHDFNNVLTVVVASSSEARRLTASGETVREEIDAIEAAGRQGMSLTRQLLDYARERPTTPQRVAPADILRSMAPICDRLVSLPHRVVWQVQETAPLLMDASQFEQVVMNLVVNARDAMEATPGTVTVSLANAVITQPTAGLAPGTYVRLDVADTGCGIPADLLPSIFDPFVTTKEARGGTGLGLATVQGIAREHGGDAMIQSVVGQGTTVSVWMLAATGTP